MNWKTLVAAIFAFFKALPPIPVDHLVVETTVPDTSPPNVVPEPIATSTPPLAHPLMPAEPKYDFSTQLKAKHSVRVICDEEGLSFADKNDLTACVRVESQFLNYHLTGPNVGQPVTHENFVIMELKQPDGTIIHQRVLSSTDWGIVQVNDHYHIGAGKDFATVSYVLANPDAAVRWMARLFKAGQKHLWSSYVSGAYKAYLPTAANPLVI